jgi:hypothetical protein
MSDLWRFFAVAIMGICFGWVWGNTVGWKDASEFYKNLINRAYGQKEGKEDE